MHINSMLIDEMSQLLHAHYRVTKTKNPNMDQPRSKNDAKDLDTKPDKSSTLPVIGAHTADGDSTDTTKKTDSKDFTQGGARGAHILDGEDLPNEITKRAQVSADGCTRVCIVDSRVAEHSRFYKATKFVGTTALLVNSSCAHNPTCQEDLFNFNVCDDVVTTSCDLF